MTKSFKDFIYEKLEIVTYSNIVKAWAEKYDIKEDYLKIFWKRAICAFLEDGKKGCKPQEEDWGTITDIFKMEVKKHFHIEDIENPVIKGKKVKIHYDEKKIDTVMEEYYKELDKCCKKCPEICKE